MAKAKGTIECVGADSPYSKARKNYLASTREDPRCVINPYGSPESCCCRDCASFKKNWNKWAYAPASYLHPLTQPSLISALEIGNYHTTEEPVWLVGNYLYYFYGDKVYYSEVPLIYGELEMECLAQRIVKQAKNFAEVA